MPAVFLLRATDGPVAEARTFYHLTVGLPGQGRLFVRRRQLPVWVLVRAKRALAPLWFAPDYNSSQNPPPAALRGVFLDPRCDSGCDLNATPGSNGATMEKRAGCDQCGWGLPRILGAPFEDSVRASSVTSRSYDLDSTGSGRFGVDCRDGRCPDPCGLRRPLHNSCSGLTSKKRCGQKSGGRRETGETIRSHQFARIDSVTPSDEIE